MARRYFFGSFRDDEFTGSNLSEVYFTGSGNDYVNAGGGNDVVFAGRGNDTVIAGSGNDVVFAGSGNDTVYGGSGRDVIFGDSGNDNLFGGTGNDYLSGGSGCDWLVGGDGHDYLTGGRGSDALFGNAGADRLYGGSGHDQLDGGTGNDLLSGGSGNDTLTGGDGADRMFGGSGDDVFVLSPSEETGGTDYVAGGRGIDTLVLNLSAEDFASQDVADDLVALLNYIEARRTNNGQVWGPALALDSLNLRVEDVEFVRVFVDGVEVNPLDAGPGTGGGNEPVAVDDSFNVNEGETLSGDVTANDTADAGTTVTLVSGVTAGTLVLNDDGTFSFDAGDDFDALAAGETQEVSFTYTLSGEGETTTATATITVTGTNDAPVVSAPLTGVATENGDALVLDLLAGATDVDSATLTISDVDGISADSGITIDGTTLTLDPNAPAYDSLAQGQTQTITLNYTVSDDAGGSVAQTVTLTVTGTNDAPTVNGALNVAADEDASASLDLLSGASDVDAGAILSLGTVSGLTNGLSIDGTVLSIDGADASFQSLAAGETREITLTYDVTDEFGATASQTATITVTGLNDAPTTAAALAATATEDGASVSLDLLSGASDADAGDSLSVANVSTLPAGVSLDGTTLSLDPSDAAYQSLALGETADVTVTYDIVDAAGATIAQTATFTVTGTNDAPTASAELTSGATRGSGEVSLDLLSGASDVDGDTLTIENVSALPDGVSLDGTTLVVNTNDAAFAGLNEGDSLALVVTYSVSDGNGGTIARTATVTVSGSNSGPVVSDPVVVTVAEDAAALDVDLLLGTVDPDGDTLSVINVSELPAGVSLDGTTLSVDPSDAAFQALSEGESLTLTVSYDITGSSADPVAQTATITVTGTNDAPTVGAALSAAATEGGATVALDLLDGASDVDAGSVLSVANVSELPDGVSLDGTTLSVDPTDAAFDALAEGEVLTLTVTYDVVDVDGGSAAQTATLTVTGTNDAPTVAGALSATATEDGAVATLDLLSGASDVDAGDSLTIANLSALPAGVTLDGTVLSVDPSDAAFQSLAAGAASTFVLTYDVVDSTGASVAQTATLSVTGTNDAPTVEGALAVLAVEDGAALSFDLLSGASDIDAGDVLAISNVAGLVSGLTLDGTSLSVDPSDADFQALAAGETRDITVTYDIIDNNGGIVSQTLTLTLTGTNDAPKGSASFSGAATESTGEVRLDLAEDVTDVDAGDTLSVTNVAGLVPGLTLDGNDVVVDTDHPDFQSIAQGAVREIVLTLDVVDGNGGTLSRSYTVIITGENDAPTVASVLSASADEDAAGFTLDLLDGTSDVDAGTELTIANVAGLRDGVTLDGTTLSVDPSNASFQALAQGEVLTVTVTYDVADLYTSIPQTATLTITGTNDAPTVAAALTATADEDASAVTLDLLDGASDVDTGAVLSVTNVAGLVAGVTLDGNVLTLDPSDASFQSLAQGQTREIVVTYDVTDEFGATAAQTATLTVTGTNDAPVVAAALSDSATEDGVSLILDLLAGASDVDDGAVLSVANVTGLVPGVTVVDGDLLVDASDAEFQSLAQGETREIVVSYDVVDEAGASVAQTATITLTGTNDAPTIDAALSDSVTEDGVSLVLNLLAGASDVDAGAVLSVANVTGLIPGVTVVDGDLLVDASNAEFQSLAQGQTRDIVVSYDVVDAFGASVAQTATITVAGTNDTPTVAAALAGAADEDSAAISLDLLAGASDVDDGAVLSVANLVGLTPGVTLDGTTLTLDPSDAAFQALAAAETQDITVTYDVVDEFGASVAQTASFTITGTNDAPTVEGALRFADSEDAPVSQIDLLDGAADVDAGAVLSVANLVGLVDGVTLDGTTLSVDPSDAAFQSLSAGQTREIVVTYDVTDGTANTSQAVIITLTGTNDLPVVDGVNTTAVAEGDAAQLINLLANVTDVDELDTLQVTNVNGLVPGLVLDVATNSVGIDPSSSVFDGLADGETNTITLTYDVTDGQGGVVPATATIVVTGTNDAPVVSAPITATLSEDTGSRDFDLLAGASDVDAGATLSVVLDEATLPDGFTLLPDGQTLQVRPFLIAAAQALQVGETLDVTVNYMVTDELGAAVMQSATIIFTGANDRPVSTINYGVQQIDFDAAYSLTLPADQFFDVDGDDLTLSVAQANGDPLPAWLSYDAATQTFSGTPTAADGGGLTVRVTADDGNGGIRNLDINFAIGDGVIVGTPGDDGTLVGTNGADTFFAGAGTDRMEGGRGNDTYVFLEGDGQDTVAEISSFNTTDTIVFSDYDLADATFTQVDQRTYIVSFANGDSVTVENGLGSANQRIEVLQFADQSLDSAGILSTLAAAQATDGDDLVLGTSDANTLTGGLGTDRLEGGAGSDTYVFNAGDGQDTVRETLSFNTTDRVVFNGYDLADATFVKVDLNTYQVTFANGDSVTLENGMGSANERIEVLEFDDQTLNFNGILEALIEAQATDGDDFVQGTRYAETLFGGTGTDRLEGGAGNDTYVFAEGDGVNTVRERLSFNTTDVIQFTDYNIADALFTRISTTTYRIDFVNGDSVTVENGFGSANEQIERIDFLDGSLDQTAITAALNANQATDGDDTISGSSGDDIIFGGRGNDSLLGGSGSDLYRFNVGDGQDTLFDNGSTGDIDTLDFTGYALADATFSRVNFNDYQITFANGDSVVVENGLNDLRDNIDIIQFTDQSIDFATIRQTVFDTQITDGDDTVLGFLTDDTLEGGLGNDRLEGDRGNDTYIFNVGDGQDSVFDDGLSSNTNDTIVFTGYDLADATFERVNFDDYRVSFANGDSVLVDNGVNNSSDRIESLQFQDQTLNFSQILTAITEAQQTDGDDTILGTDFGDTIEGGLGNDILRGDFGEDTYIFNVGDGQDTLFDDGVSGQTDMLIFTGYALADATFVRVNYNDYRVEFANGDSVLVQVSINRTRDSLDVIQFTDQSLNYAEIREAVIATTQTDGDDTVLGTDFGDTLEGGLGNDRLEGDFGADTYIFNVGDGQDSVRDDGTSGQTDTIVFTGYALADATIERVNFDDYRVVFANGDSVTVDNGLNTTSDDINVLQFTDQSLTTLEIRAAVVASDQTDGDDTVQGTVFADTLNGGLGNDRLEGDSGADTYVFGVGGGQDVVRDDGFSRDVDTIEFTDYNFADATFTLVNTNDYAITFANGDSVLVVSGLNNTSDRIEQVQFVDQLLDFAGIQAALAANSGSAVADVIQGSNYGDQLSGLAGDDTINGAGGDDVLSGGDGNDLLIGGAGNDILAGGAGTNTYEFSSGDGNDFIDDGNGDNDDILVFTDFASADATYSRIGPNLLIEFANGDSVQIENASGGATDSVVEVRYTDQTLTVADILDSLRSQPTAGDDSLEGTADNDIIDGLAGDDSLAGLAGDDILSGGAGNDTITGGAGADQILFASGDGRDIVVSELFFDGEPGLGDQDTLVFSDYNLADATFSSSFGDLRIDFANGDRVTVSDAFSSPAISLTQVQFADQTVALDDIPQQIIDQQQTDGDDFIVGTAGDDVFEGGLGDDTFDAGPGDDLFLFDAGDGDDTIIEFAGDDTVNFGTLNAADATFFGLENGDIVIEFTSGDSVTIAGAEGLIIGPGPIDGGGPIIIDGPEGPDGPIGLPPIDGNVETFIFADQVLTLADVEALLVPPTPLTLVGTDADETLTGGLGNDTLTGGLGNDLLEGGASSDTYIFRAGDGSDTIVDTGGDNDVLIIEGYSRDDMLNFFGETGVGLAFFDREAGPDATPDEILLGFNEIETFVFIPDPAQPDVTETFTYEELFGEFGPGGPPLALVAAPETDILF